MSVKRPDSSFVPRLKSGRGTAQTALILATSVVVTALLSVPRPAAINELPLPKVNWEQVRAERLANVAALKEAQGERLSYELRSVGELVRRFGEAEVGADAAELEVLRRELIWAAQLALKKHGPAAIGQLVRLQAQLFLDAARRWDGTEEPSPELVQLGGTFARRAKQGRWLSSEPEDLETALSTMFRIRWIKITGLSRLTELSPTADDWRRYYGFLLQRPGGATLRDRVGRQLALVEGLGKYDSTYPLPYAQGVLYFRIGEYQSAYQSFRRHLTQNPNGRFALRARNGAAAAASRMLGG